MIFNTNPVCSVNTPHMQQLQACPCLDGVVQCFHISERSHEQIRVKLFFQVLKDFWREGAKFGSNAYFNVTGVCEN